MEVNEQINTFLEFFEKHYEVELLTALSTNKNFIFIDFVKLSIFSPELAELLIEQPEETLKAAELAIKKFSNEEIKHFNIRITNLPKEREKKIREIRTEDIGKLIFVEGIVKQKSDVRPQVISARFECPSCGNIISVLQTSQTFSEPSSCSCGRKGKFKLLSKEMIDAQGIVLEEIPELLEGGEQPKRINVFLQEDLVSPISERKTNPGSKIRVIGWIKEKPITTKTGSKLTRFDLMIEANNVESIEETFYEVKISKEEEEKIKELAQDPKIYKKLVDSVAPSIFGYDKIKEALVLQLFGGVRKKRSDGVLSRGDIHILLVGDPGAGKSQLLKRISLIAPKGRYVSGKGVSGAGLTATVVRDDFLGGWSLEAGALVLSNDGICCIDELDKMSNEDRIAMHEALEQQTISIAKANIQATLLARTTVLAAANPKFGRFNRSETLAKQIDLPPTLINRFDLIFPIQDIPDEKRDESMARHILQLHQNPEMQEPEIPTELLKKYIAYARQKVNPKLTDAAIEEIKDYYVKMRSSEKGEGEESKVPIISSSARQLEALVRLAEASARVRLSDKVSKKDARRAIELLTFCLSQVAADEGGRIDIDRITTGITASQRSKIIIFKEILENLEKSLKSEKIPKEKIINKCQEEGILADEVEEIIEKLRRSGDIFEPERGFIQRI
ncbi:MAG: minichromosome maintenance protein MCM [Candidatus Woesearchaeota archaeon]